MEYLFQLRWDLMFGFPTLSPSLIKVIQSLSKWLVIHPKEPLREHEEGNGFMRSTMRSEQLVRCYRSRQRHKSRMQTGKRADVWQKNFFDNMRWIHCKQWCQHWHACYTQLWCVCVRGVSFQMNSDTQSQTGSVYSAAQVSVCWKTLDPF